jgi:RNA polymerase sigma-70 factor (ECF subfamily)
MDGSAAIGGFPLAMREAAFPWPQSPGEFAGVVELLQHRLVQYALFRLHSREDAEDAVQDVLVRAYRDRQRYKAVDNAAPYLFRMVANQCTDVLRRRKRQAGGEAGAEPAAPPEAPDDGTRLRLIEALLARLPARQAEVIRLRVWAELPFDAVAETMGCSVPTVKSRFRYGVKKLRRALTRLGGER